jgi:DNA polymerase-3 subunit delta'
MERVYKSYPYGNIYDWLQFIGAENKQGNITAHECNDIIRTEPEEF